MNLTTLTNFLAQTPTKMQDFFKGAGDTLNEAPDSSRLLGLIMAAAGLVILLIVINQRRQREAAPRILKHHGKLLKEIVRQIPLRASELKQLKTLAEQEEYASPLVLLLCPSLLAKALQKRPGNVNRKIMGRVSRKLGN